MLLYRQSHKPYSQTHIAVQSWTLLIVSHILLCTQERNKFLNISNILLQMCCRIILIFCNFICLLGVIIFHNSLNDFVSIHIRTYFFQFPKGSTKLPVQVTIKKNKTTHLVRSLTMYTIRHTQHHSSVWAVYCVIDCCIWTVQKDIFSGGIEVMICVQLSGAGIDSCTPVQWWQVSLVRFLVTSLML
jgi:hypothetical protein